MYIAPCTIVHLLVHNRELAQQIQEQATKFAGPCELRCIHIGVVCGGGH